jgi:hypothetical protein
MNFRLLILFLFITGCTSLNTKPENWESEIPARDLFVRAYESDQVNRAIQSEGDYLKWIKLFYLGRGISVPGWIRVSEDLLYLTEDNEKTIAAEELELLGKKISMEWAKDNSMRRIPTSVMLSWRDIMYKASENNMHLEAVRLIDADVDALIAEDVDPDSINSERYAAMLGLSTEELPCDLFDLC